MTIFLTVTSPPQWTQSPLTFQAEHSEAVPWTGWWSAVGCGCSARHSCLPAHLPSTHCQSASQRASGAASQRLWLQEATAQSLAFWAELLTPPYLSYVVSHHRISQDHLGKSGEGEWAVAVHNVQWRTAQRQAHLLVLSVFSTAADGAPHVINDEKRKEIAGFCLTVCY